MESAIWILPSKSAPFLGAKKRHVLEMLQQELVLAIPGIVVWCREGINWIRELKESRFAWLILDSFPLPFSHCLDLFRNKTMDQISVWLVWLRVSESKFPYVLGSKLTLFPYIIGDGHQPNSRGLYTHYKHSLLKVGDPGTYALYDYWWVFHRNLHIVWQFNGWHPYPLKDPPIQNWQGGRLRDKDANKPRCWGTQQIRNMKVKKLVILVYDWGI